MTAFRWSVRDLTELGRGLLMGGADIIPGVSGGTIALILGIYERLVTAISRFDLELLRLLRGRQWSAAAGHVDLRFLLALGCGIAAGIGALASAMHYLLEHHQQQTFAAFFGMILASTVIVARIVPRWGKASSAAVAASVAVAYWLVGLPFLENPPASIAYVFLCGLIAICAMILPGISGAFILLLLGKYYAITGIIKNAVRFDATAADLLTLLVFATGAVLGLLSFSKLLRYLLAHHEATTMAVLAGFMLGSLRKIWPFKRDLTPDQVEYNLKRFDNLLPDLGSGGTWLTITIAVAGAAFVFTLDRISRPRRLSTATPGATP